LYLNSRDLAILNEFIVLLSLCAEVETTRQKQYSPSMSLVAPSISDIYFDLKNEKKNIQHDDVMLYYHHYYQNLVLY
jgi:hypothetical protein